AGGPDDSVNTMVLSAGSLFIGGDFTNYRGDAKGFKLAKLDATTGVLDTGAGGFNTVASAGPNGSVVALALSGTSLYAGGTFDQYRADTRGKGLIKVSTTDGS